HSSYPFFVFYILPLPPRSTLFPYTTLFRSLRRANDWTADRMKSYGLTKVHLESWPLPEGWERGPALGRIIEPDNGFKLSLAALRSEEHTSELQSRGHLVCRLLLEKKKKIIL